MTCQKVYKRPIQAWHLQCKARHPQPMRFERILSTVRASDLHPMFPSKKPPRQRQTSHGTWWAAPYNNFPRSQLIAGPLPCHILFPGEAQPASKTVHVRWKKVSQVLLILKVGFQASWWARLVVRLKIDGNVPSFKLQYRKKGSEIEINVGKHGKIQYTNSMQPQKTTCFIRSLILWYFLGRAWWRFNNSFSNSFCTRSALEASHKTWRLRNSPNDFLVKVRGGDVYTKSPGNRN